MTDRLLRGHPTLMGRSFTPPPLPPRASAFAFAIAFALASASALGCGGKIAPGTSNDSPAAASTTTDPSSPSTPGGPSLPGVPPPDGDDAGVVAIDAAVPTSVEACQTLCDRHAACGALQPDCVARCTGDLTPGTACFDVSTAYLHCFADNLPPGCSVVPPLCEPEFCAYSRCTGRVVPSYCP